ncbi:hypothetical protein [Amycolatopsis viridis]|uniref:Minor tail protein n=1 Tax=Amycolatopsis viridis TaxID=185678 RepID=A0ABX0T1E8_9PSEU|nr:hypothetical protein [Amycolatopsis viridis]NIH81685.1 hypothetical protein [Amycolatopsis viridis]
MTLTATYADDLSRVRLAITGAPAQADYALIERSTDQITWATVRGGDTVPLSSGAGQLDDYEFAAGVPNYYRASYVDSGAVTSVGLTPGGPVTGNNTALTPALPSGITAGDLLLAFATIRNTAAAPVAPAGWTAVHTTGSTAVFGRRYLPGDAAPTVTFTGGAAGDSTTAVVWALRNAELLPAVSVWQNNASAQNVAYPAITAGGSNDRLTVLFAWKQAQHTGWGTPAGFVDVTRVSNAQGSGDSTFVFLAAYPTSVPAGNVIVTGGAAAVSKATLLTFQKAAYVTRDTASTTPNIQVAWIKNLQRPYLNRAVTVTDWSAITRPARAGVIDVISRSLPVAVTDLRGSRRYTLTITAVDLDAAADLDLCLSTGEPVLLHVPAGAPFPGGYYVIGDITMDRHSKRTKRRFFDLPLTEVAAPAGTIVGQTVLYADLLTAFTSYTALIAAEPTYADVLDRIADPTDVIVP